MDKVERAIEKLVQTQDDVVTILKMNFMNTPDVLNSVTALSSATQLYNEAVWDVIKILKEDN